MFYSNMKGRRLSGEDANWPENTQKCASISHLSALYDCSTNIYGTQVPLRSKFSCVGLFLTKEEYKKVGS